MIADDGSDGRAPPAAYRGAVKERCLEEALRIIDEGGLEALSFREVSRRVGVSHQAPYKYFDSKDDILAELLTRCFTEFAVHLEARPRSVDPWVDMRSMGEAYFDYARRHPLKYRLMFGTSMPDPERHPEMMGQARRAFALLKARLTDMPVRPTATTIPTDVALDALFVWSTIHGLASLLGSDVLPTLGFTEHQMHGAIAHCLQRIGAALEPPGAGREA
ncbi:TetR/AcrR family transcriptional regulator [Bradyrhizobium roseum]|uniref:TetR/AcrR family transcriptional regulator n=1 Tax=Bradyrhizobium roseum TaxID=3056648 RepID=UPI002638CB43|nr:TetR/AcrR family transcriptional regulator [Bradyrhizobium roseus]WKA31438.1 TetR/AcrR family transcriptional regulator [Bradyrhizobium roseus]